MMPFQKSASCASESAAVGLFSIPATATLRELRMRAPGRVGENTGSANMIAAASGRQIPQ
jgi:hypothetical protein